MVDVLWRRGWAGLLCAVLCAAPAWAEQPAASLLGVVSVLGADGQPFQVPGVSLTLRPAADAAAPLSTFTDATGAYEFPIVPAGRYVLEALLDGFTAVQVDVVVAGSGSAVTLAPIQLTVAGVRESVLVTANAPGIEATSAAPADRLGEQILENAPLASEQFQDALPLVPGVVRGPDGILSLKGARAGQSGLTVNSANVTDPVSGEYAFNLPVEVVESVEVLSNPYAPEYGKLAGAVTNVATRAGTDRWKVQLQNFLPRVRREGGSVAGLESLTPRVTVGGPLPGRGLTLLQSVEYKYTKTIVESREAFRADTKLESLTTFTQVDWTPGTRDHLSVAFSVFPQDLSYVGLNAFSPQSVTPNFRQRGYFVAANERRVIRDQDLLEVSFNVKEFDARVEPSSVGADPVMILGSRFNSGTFFNNQDRDSRRIEGLVTYSHAPAGSAHFVKAGIGINRDEFDGFWRASPVEIRRADGTVAERTEFQGDTRLTRSKADVTLFVQDKWQVHPLLTLEYGLRYDRDSITRENNLAPRIGVAFVPTRDARTVVRGGVGLFYDKVTLNQSVFESLPSRTVTRFDPSARALTTTNLPNLVGPTGFRTPRSVTWNVEVDREWHRNLLARVGYQQREGRREYVLDLAQDPAGASALLLQANGRSRYRELQVTARYHAGPVKELVVSYVRSSATGDLNDFSKHFGNFPDPVIRPNERSRLGFDAPHRLLVWGDFELPGGISLSPIYETRTGFPLSTFDEVRDFVGPRNEAGRFRRFESLDLQATKRVTLPVIKRRARVGVRVFNVVNRFNPRDFQGNVDSDEFGVFFNGVGRAFRGRVVLEF